MLEDEQAKNLEHIDLLERALKQAHAERDELKQFNDWLMDEMWDMRYGESLNPRTSIEAHRVNMTNYWKLVKDT